MDLWVRLNNWWVKMSGLLARYEAGSQVFLRVKNFKSLRQVSGEAFLQCLKLAIRASDLSQALAIEIRFEALAAVQIV